LADLAGPGPIGPGRGASPPLEPRTASIRSNQPAARPGRETHPPVHATPASRRTPAIAGRRRLRPSIGPAGGIGPIGDAGWTPDAIGRARDPGNPASGILANADDSLAWVFRATGRARRLRAAGVPGWVERRWRVVDAGIKAISVGFAAPGGPIPPGSPT
jgi:hypothetical protein